jgi:hypothetical protein
MATRRSPGDISETMPTVIPGMDLLECKHGNRIGGKKNPGRRQTASKAGSSNVRLVDLLAVKRQHDIPSVIDVY